MPKNLKGVKSIKWRYNMVNLNDMSRRIALKEGGHKNLKISDIKEVMKLVFIELAKLDMRDVHNILKKYK